jgi:anti-sigma regulatory factor (Ser/Thr protein kinase)
LEIRLSKEELIFEISDHGKTFDLEHGTGRKAGELGMGGWGTLMMQNGFQRIERRRVGNKNILLLACLLPVQKGDR